MSSDAPGGSGIPSNGGAAASAQAEGGAGTATDMEKMVNDAIGRALSQRLPRMKSIEEQVSKAVETALAARLQATENQKAPTASEAPATEGHEGRSTLKALEERVRQQEAKLQAALKAQGDAEMRARDASMRARVQAEIAKYLPADSPHHAPYVATLYDVQKRFAEEGGSAAVKFKREWGEEAVPLEQGIKELFETELKHLVQHSRASQLPPGAMPGLPGQPMQQRPQQGQQPRNAIHDVVAAHFAANGEVEKATAIMTPSVAPTRK